MSCRKGCPRKPEIAPPTMFKQQPQPPPGLGPCSGQQWAADQYKQPPNTKTYIEPTVQQRRRGMTGPYYETPPWAYDTIPPKKLFPRRPGDSPSNEGSDECPNKRPRDEWDTTLESEGDSESDSTSLSSEDTGEISEDSDDSEESSQGERPSHIPPPPTRAPPRLPMKQVPYRSASPNAAPRQPTKSPNYENVGGSCPKPTSRQPVSKAKSPDYENTRPEPIYETIRSPAKQSNSGCSYANKEKQAPPVVYGPIPKKPVGRQPVPAKRTAQLPVQHVPEYEAVMNVTSKSKLSRLRGLTKRTLMKFTCGNNQPNSP